MPSYDNERFQPLPPIRTTTSHSSGTTSPEMLSPTSTYSRGGGRSPTSPAEDSFFGAISAKIRGRSRSRSRAAASRKRSTSPMLLPPRDLPPTRAPHAHPQSPTTAAAAHNHARRPHQPRHASSASQSSFVSAPGKPSPSRRSTGSSDMWRGRHSNSWLFNDFSFTETASKAFGRNGKSSSS